MSQQSGGSEDACVQSRVPQSAAAYRRLSRQRASVRHDRTTGGVFAQKRQSSCRRPWHPRSNRHRSNRHTAHVETQHTALHRRRHRHIYGIASACFCFIICFVRLPVGVKLKMVRTWPKALCRHFRRRPTRRPDSGSCRRCGHHDQKDCPAIIGCNALLISAK